MWSKWADKTHILSLPLSLSLSLSLSLPPSLSVYVSVSLSTPSLSLSLTPPPLSIYSTVVIPYNGITTDQYSTKALILL